MITCNPEVVAGDAHGDQILDPKQLALHSAVGDGLPTAQAGAEDFDALLALAFGDGRRGSAGLEALFEAELHVVVVAEAANEEKCLWAVTFLLESADLLAD